MQYRDSTRNGNPRELEHSDHAGAVELARRLGKFWLDRGFNISTTIVPIQVNERTTVHCVRSNLVNGLPPPESRVLVVKEAA
jgi:hypothetical protein